MKYHVVMYKKKGKLTAKMFKHEEGKTKMVDKDGNVKTVK